MTPVFNTTAGADAGAELSRRLIHAVIRDRGEEVTALLQAGADINWQSRRCKKSLLHIAAEYNRQNAAAALIAAKAPLNLQDYRGYTALASGFSNTAVLRHRDESFPVAKQLLAAGADPNIRNNWGHSAASTPIIFAMHDLVDPMMKNGLDMTTRDRDGRTLLYLATCFRSRSVLRRFIKAGADVNVQDDNGQTPLMKCIEYDLYRHMLTLTAAGARVETADTSGRTALHHAAQAIKPRAVSVLLKYGAVLDEPDAKGKTAMDYAEEALKTWEDICDRRGSSLAPDSDAVKYRDGAREIHALLLKTREDKFRNPFMEGVETVKSMPRIKLKQPGA